MWEIYLSNQIETAEMKATHNIYSQMCAIKPTAQYSKIMSIGRAQLRGKHFTLKIYLCPFLCHPADIFISDIYFYVIQILLEEEGEASKPDSPVKWLPFRASFS